MIRSCFVAALASGLVFHLGGCQKGPASPPPEAVASDVPLTGPSVTPAAGLPVPARPEPALAKPHVPSASRDPAVVLEDMAKTIEARDWRGVRAFWGDHGTRSGMDEPAFAAKWSALTAPVVTVGAGAQEGGAGSLYYTAPITIVDGSRTIRGEITIRRVNDVDGASPEQLRWHVESTTLEI